MDAENSQTLSFPICFHGNAEDMLCFRELGINPFMNSNDNISWNRPSPAVWFRCAYGLYQSQLILADKQGTDRSENAGGQYKVSNMQKTIMDYHISAIVFIEIIAIFCNTRFFCFKRRGKYNIFYYCIYCFFSLL